MKRAIGYKSGWHVTVYENGYQQFMKRLASVYNMVSNSLRKRLETVLKKLVTVTKIFSNSLRKWLVTVSNHFHYCL